MLPDGREVDADYLLWCVRLHLRCGVSLRGGVGLRYCVGGVGGVTCGGSSLSGGGSLWDCHAATSQMTPMARRSGAAPIKKDAMKKMPKTMRFLAFIVVRLLFGEEITEKRHGGLGVLR